MYDLHYIESNETNIQMHLLKSNAKLHSVCLQKRIDIIVFVLYELYIHHPHTQSNIHNFAVWNIPAWQGATTNVPLGIYLNHKTRKVIHNSHTHSKPHIHTQTTNTNTIYDFIRCVLRYAEIAVQHKYELSTHNHPLHPPMVWWSALAGCLWWRAIFPFNVAFGYYMQQSGNQAC